MKYTEPKIIKENKSKKEARIKFWKVFLIEGGLFLLTSILAVVGAFELNKLTKAKEVYLPNTSLQDFLFSFIFVTFFVLLFVLYKNKKINKFKELIYKGIFVFVVFWGGMTILDLFFPVYAAILIMGILLMLWLKFSLVWVHDVLMFLGLAGAASFFGLSFTPSVVVALLLIFSIYDFIAVYKTKHMILMAKEMIDKKVILGFIIPKDFNYFKAELKEIKTGGNFMILGGGDVVFPSLLAVSIIPFGFINALLIVLFSLVGLFFTYYLFITQKSKEGSPEPIPALPPIALCAIIGYFITLLL